MFMVLITLGFCAISFNYTADYAKSNAMRANKLSTINDIAVYAPKYKYGSFELSLFKEDENGLLRVKELSKLGKIFKPYSLHMLLQSTEQYVESIAEQDSKNNNFNNIFVDESYQILYNDSYKKNSQKIATEKAIIDAQKGVSNDELLSNPLLKKSYQEAYVLESAKIHQRNVIKELTYRKMVEAEEENIAVLDKDEFKKVFGIK